MNARSTDGAPGLPGKGIFRLVQMGSVQFRDLVAQFFENSVLLDGLIVSIGKH